MHGAVEVLTAVVVAVRMNHVKEVERLQFALVVTECLAPRSIDTHDRPVRGHLLD